MANPTITVAVTLGNAADLFIADNDHLYIQQKTGTADMIIDLGLATEKRIEQIQDYLGRMYCHAVKESA